MSAQFILEYAGWPMSVPSLKLVTEDRATVFTSEADAWLAAHQTGLAAHAFQVRSLYAEDKAAAQQHRPTDGGRTELPLCHLAQADPLGRPANSEWDATNQPIA
jgi:hypothetical protein